MLPNQGGVLTEANVATINRNFNLVNNYTETLGSIVRRGQAYAALVNPYNAPPYNDCDAWTTGVTYTAGQIVTSDTPTRLYMCVVAGVAGASPPTGTSVASVSDGTDSWVYCGPAVTGVGPTCTVTQPGSVDGALTLEYRYVLNPSAFYPRGGIPVLGTATFYGINSQNVLGSGNISGTANQMSTAWCFDTSAPKLCIRNDGTTAYRIVVDGRFITYSGEVSSGYTTLDWGGYRKMRHYELQVSRNFGLSAIFVDPQSEVTYPAYSNPIAAMFIGDSISAGSSWGGILPDLDIPSLVSRTMGFTNWMNQGTGGSGYNATAGGTVYNFPQRPKTNYTNVTPDVVFIWGGQNDSLTGLAGQVTGYLAQLRLLLPTQPFVVLGRYPSPNTGGSTADSEIATEAAISEGVQRWSDTNKLFIPIIGAPGGSWFTGTGNVSSISAGNTSSFVGPDNIHPTFNGNVVLADFICQALRSTASQATV